jgi:uncharacterized protein (TIGR04255 family)
MAVKYKNPPVIYAVAKLIFAESIGSYGEDKYKILLASLKELGFDSYSVSKITGIQLKQSDNTFSATPANTERVGYFSPNRTKCAVINENTLELRLTEYDNHSSFLDSFCKFIELCNKNKIALGNKLREIELHYVDLFVPDVHGLQNMFSNISLPNEPFYSEESDMLKIGSIQFTRILSSGKTKVSVNLEQLKAVDPTRRKYLPDILMEPDQQLTMPISSDRFFGYHHNSDYALVHTCCSALIDALEMPLDEMRKKFEELYQESRKTFDAMINDEVCNEIWKPVD